MRIAYEVARNTIGRNMKVQKRYHDRNQYLNQYQIGDAVLKRCMAPVEKGTKKFAPRWVGPFFVIDKLDDRTYRIAADESRPRKVTHHDRLKPYHFDPEQQFDNRWVFKVTKTKIKPECVDVQVQTDSKNQDRSEELLQQDELEDLEHALQPDGENDEIRTSIRRHFTSYLASSGSQKTGVQDETTSEGTNADQNMPMSDLILGRKTVQVTRCDEPDQVIMNMERRGRPRKLPRLAAKVNSILVPLPQKFQRKTIGRLPGRNVRMCDPRNPLLYAPDPGE